MGAREEREWLGEKGEMVVKNQGCGKFQGRNITRSTFHREPKRDKNLDRILVDTRPLLTSLDMGRYSMFVLFLFSRMASKTPGIGSQCYQLANMIRYFKIKEAS